MITDSFSPQDIALALSQGDLVVLRTDTIYGIIALAANAAAVQKLYAARHRNPSKACIVLVADIADIPDLSDNQRIAYEELSIERPTTIVQPVSDNFLSGVPREDGALAFRVVKLPQLHKLISLTGPLLAPSANIEGLPPATNVRQAVDYFGDKVSLYVDGGRVLENSPSRIVKFENGALRVLR